MRKVLLVVALVAASFAGGAAVNGPGLQWLKGLVRDRMGRDEAIPTLDVDVDDGSSIATATATAKTSEPEADPPKPEVPVPIAPVPQPEAKPEPPPLAAPKTPSEPSPLPALPDSPLPNEAEPRSPRDKASPKTGWEDAPGDAPSTAIVPKSRVKPRAEAPAIADSAVSAVAAAAPAPAEPPPLAPSSPSPSPNPTLSAEPSAMPVPPIGVGSAPGDWTALRKRMAALGVQEYEVKGTPGGPVRFRCLVPGSGAEAAKPFESEGDDEFQAAESALRRVAVWRAARRVKG